MSADPINKSVPIGPPHGPADNNPGGPRHPDPADLALYAMQLLSREDSATVAHHLEHCPPCREELARILGDLSAYSLSVELESPTAGARQRLLKQVAREKKVVPIAQPPAATQAATQPAPHPAPLASFRRSGSVPSIENAQPKPSAARAVLAWAGWAAAALLAVAVTFLYRDRQTLNGNLAAENGEIKRLNNDAAESHQLMDALTDPRAIRVTLTTKAPPRTGPIAGVTYNPDKGTLVFLASDLDPLQQYKTYELWVIPQDGSAPVPAGTFHPDERGNASVILPDLPKGIPAKAFGVTVEDNGGSQTPTLPIIMAGS